MNIEQIPSGLLVNEWHLGEQLNTAVHNGTRSKFNLLLSMLSNDALDLAQFTYKQAQIDGLQTVSLREEFELSEAQPLVNKGISLSQANEFNNDIQNNSLSSIRLKQLLTNEPVLSRTYDNPFPTDILDNLSLVVKNRLMNKLKEEDGEAPNQPIIAKGLNSDLIKKYQEFEIRSNSAA